MIILHNGYNGESGGDDEDGTPPANRIRSYAGAAPGGIDSWVSLWCGISAGFFATTSAYRGVADSSIARFNVIMHEFLHTFNMIDLYDISFAGNGCGVYDLMGYPSGPGNDATNPGNLGAYTKMFLNWITPIEITNDGLYTINESYSSQDIYKIILDTDEYFLIENKNAVGWDVNIWGGGGIVIW